jgi:hypothetical protein
VPEEPRSQVQGPGGATWKRGLLPKPLAAKNRPQGAEGAGEEPRRPWKSRGSTVFLGGWWGKMDCMDFATYGWSLHCATYLAPAMTNVGVIPRHRITLVSRLPPCPFLRPIPLQHNNHKGTNSMASACVNNAFEFADSSTSLCRTGNHAFDCSRATPPGQQSG